MSRDGAGLESRARRLLPGAGAAYSQHTQAWPDQGESREWLDPGATLRAERGKQAGPETLCD